MMIKNPQIEINEREWRADPDDGLRPLKRKSNYWF